MSTIKTTTVKSGVCAFVLLLVVLSIGYVHADEVPGFSPSTYYKMGGGNAVIAEALNASGIGKVSIVRAPMRLPSACDIWARRENLGSYMETLITSYFQTELQNGINKLIVLVKGMPEQLIVSQLQKALPGTYDWMTNSLSQISFKVDDLRASCEANVAAGGVGAVADWVDAAKSLYWQKTLDPAYDAESATSNLLAVGTSEDVTGMNTPIEWFGGEAGASADKPITVVKDIVSAGYAATSSAVYGGSTVTAPTTSPTVRVEGAGTRPNPLSDMWATSEDAYKFANRVLGEEIVQYCEGCQSSFTPGLGLKPIMSEESDELAQSWADLLTKYPPGTISKNPSMSELAEISSPGSQIHLKVFLGLREMATGDRNVYIDRLISDVALERTFEKGVALRQMIRAGAMTPEVQSYEAARIRSERMVTSIKEELEELVNDTKLREQLASNTAATLMEAMAIGELKESGASLRSGSSATPNIIRDGAPIER